MDTRLPLIITRTPGALALEGLRTTTLAALQGALPAPPALVISDLSLGAWRSHQVATEFGAQLGVPPPAAAAVAVPTGRGTLPSYADLVGTGIDAEARGDTSTLSALAQATAVLAAARAAVEPPSFVVLAPRYGLPWETENVLFLQFLAQGLRAGGGRLLIGATEAAPPVLPPGWTVEWMDAPGDPPTPRKKALLDLLPGILEPEVVAALAPDLDPAAHLRLGGGRVLVGPECRRQPGTKTRFEHDQLAVAARSFDWLEAYAQFYGNNLYVEPPFLCAQAWARFAEGGHGIALRLLERAIGCAATPMQQGVFLSQVQGMRIALHRFGDVALAPDPSPAVPESLRAFLLEAKGWGLAMSTHPADAGPYLDAARGMLTVEEYDREYLYLLNIYALYRMKAGDAETALTLEHEIEARLRQQDPPDRRLGYVNSINIARLHRRANDFDAAERYYTQAFATTLGARSESDMIYANANLARLHMDRGWAERGLIEWLRSALHWVASTVPEALGTRAATGIMGRRWVPGELIPEDVSAAFIDLLTDAAARNNLTGLPERAELAESPAPVFMRTGQTPPGLVPTGAVGAPGWSVLVGTSADNTPVPLAFAGAHHHDLRALLYALLQTLNPAPALTSAAALLVDDQLGQEMAGTLGELLETCLRLDVPCLQFEQTTLHLEADLRQQLVQRSRVGLSPAVERLEVAAADNVEVIFQRYLPPQRLTGASARLVRAAPDHPTVAALRTDPADPLEGDDILALLRTLEQARILAIYLAEDTYDLQRLVSGRL